MTHTPGPWHVNPLLDRCINTETKPVATAIQTHVRRTEWRANARLIAAAPELLEACKLLVNNMDKMDFALALPATMRIARAAIAKAEGGNR